MPLTLPEPRSVAVSSADPVEAILSSFRRGSALVDRAVAALAAAMTILARLDSEDDEACGQAMRDLGAALSSAATEGDNLLIARPSSAEMQPFVIFALAQRRPGTFAVQPIEIDRRALALSGAGAEGGTSPMATLTKALDARALSPGREAALAVQTAVRSMAQAVASASSRLSIVKARLDLQSTFLTAILDADTASPLVRLESHLNQAGAREMALATRRLLGRQSLNIANSNRRTLEALLQPHLGSLA